MEIILYQLQLKKDQKLLLLKKKLKNFKKNIIYY